MRNEQGLKVMTVSRLKTLLDSLPDSLAVCPNTVGNLMIMDGTSGERLGYIDFANETVELAN